MICQRCRRRFPSLHLAIGSIHGFRSIRICEDCIQVSKGGVAEKELITGPIISFGGILEILPESFGFVNVTFSSLDPPPKQVYVSPNQIQRNQLHSGDLIEGIARRPLDGEKYDALLIVEFVNGRPPDRGSHK